MGGRFVLLHGSRERRLSAIVSAYPSIPPELQPGQALDPLFAADQIACPVQLLYPEHDEVTPRAKFLKLQSALQARDLETVVVMFPEAGHGFLHDHNDTNDAAARIAVPQIEAFLLAHITP
jgi:dienelactone hydrolase